jgi:hypothetical protein
MAVDNLMDYELTLQGIVGDLQAAAERASLVSFETLWVSELDRAWGELHDALENLETRQLKRAIWRMNRVLAIQPSQINTRLNDAARALRLPALVAALTSVRDQLAQLDLDVAKMRQFDAGVEALANLNQSLAALVDEHDRWQIVDLELRRIEAAMRNDTMELEMSWPSLKEMTAPLYGGVEDEWVKSISADATALDDALAQDNPAKIKRFFWRYRRRAGDRFYRVDVDLLELCEALREVGGPLTSVLNMIGQ